MDEAKDEPEDTPDSASADADKDEGKDGEESVGEEDAEDWKEEEDEDSGEEEILEEEEPAVSVEDEPIYDSKDFISRPYLSENCTLPEDIVQFSYSFGYDCKRLFNLSVIDTDVLIFASGNIIHFFRASTGERWYRRSFSGQGIGHIATHPTLPHVAVGEKGDNPDIIIYEWPSFDIITILRNGTKREYTHLNYSPDGEFLCSQGGYPDHMLTIWNWKKHRITLRAKAYGEKVFNSKFSLYVPGHLTTSGTSHIKFWKINETFTGLKLQGELGRFGKTEICNIIGFLALPDEKVVSGCEWGNILVWDGGLIRVEVFRRGRNVCHEAPITQFIYNNGELMTVAMDGTIKIWYYETIELADPPDEDRIIEVEPIFDFEIGDYYHKAELMVIVKSVPDPSDTIWFGQDGNGGIWKLDLSTALSAAPPQQIYQCHAGEVVAVQASPVSSHFATLGKDGRLLLYDYKRQQLLMKKEFLPGGTCLLWLPLSVEASGSVILGGFDDGVVRVICVSIVEYLKKERSPTDEYINLVQVTKPHSKAITIITANPSGDIVVTGSEDCTIFVYQISKEEQFVTLVPIGFIPVGGIVSCFSWNPDAVATILIGCTNGTIMEIELPLEPQSDDPNTFLLEDVPMKRTKFVSVKSQIRRDQRIAEIIQEKRRLAEIEAAKTDDGEEPDWAEIENVDNIDESELPELYIPPEPNAILLVMYNPSGNVWLTVAGYDSGYIYEYNFEDPMPLLSKMVDDADDIEIYSYHYYYTKQYLILGMQDGKIRVIRMNEEDAQDFSNYWSYSMHDNANGIIYQICFSRNYQYMFTCGSDGNVFSYQFNPEGGDYKRDDAGRAQQKGFPVAPCSDIDDRDAMSLEQMKVKQKTEQHSKAANAHKRDMADMLKVLEKKFEALVKENSRLPKSQQLTREEMTPDIRVIEDLESGLRDEMSLVKRKLEWNLEKSRIQYEKLQRYYIEPAENQTLRVYGIEAKTVFVETFRLRTLGPEFEKSRKLVALKLEEQELKGRAQARLFSEEEIVEVVTRRPNPAEALMKQIMALCGDYKKNIKLRRLLRKYRERKDRLETRRLEWHDMMKKKPNPDKRDPEDIEAIKIAQDTIGDYKLKTAPDYKIPPEKKITTVSMYTKLLNTREAIYKLQKDYNDKVLNLRLRKVEMIERHTQMRKTLLEIAKEIPKDEVRDPPSLPTYDEDVEYPERKLSYTDEDVLDELPKRHKNMYRQSTVKKKGIKLLDREYEILTFDKKGQKQGKVDPNLNLMNFDELVGSKVIGELESIGKDDQVATPWEKEFRKLRVIKRLHEQDLIIERMENDIKEFDEDILRVKGCRVQTELDVKFLELYLLTVHQEVLILKKFEAAEEEKENKLFDKLMEKHEIQKKLNEINSKIESRNREIRWCEEEIKNLVTTYYAAIADSKFFDFLRRIFKKKYRPPKMRSEDSDSESESESSSSSEEDDAKSLDSKDIGPIRLDENVCPPGCDPHLYEWTFEQRSARHNLELSIAEEKKMIEMHKKEYELLVKKVKGVEAQTIACQEDLEEYMREKQRNLNEVETVVVLHLHQIQNLKSESEIEKLSESVLINAGQLSNLYKRVGELEKETNAEKNKHAKNCQHLSRMKVDINHMKDVIEKLTKEIDTVMLNKFGTKVDIDDIEESLLKRLVAEMHSIVLELQRQFETKLRSLREKLSERQHAYAMKIQENTERHNLLSVLEEERWSLQKMQIRQKEIICGEPEAKEDDVDRLEKIAKEQEVQICNLKCEIQMLKTKEKPLPPPERKPPAEIPEVVEKLMVRSFEGEYCEITADTRNELKDIFQEAQEITQDMREGVTEEVDVHRMRQLAEEFIERLPQKVQESVAKRMSKKLEPPSNVDKCKDHDTHLRDIVRMLPADMFLDVMEMVTEIMDTLSMSLEGSQSGK